MESISADGREPPPPAIIVPGKRIMDSWIHDNLKGDELILLSDSGYTNDTLAVAWIKHFIKHVDAGPDKPWKMLLLDGHTTHENDEFGLLAIANHIQLFYFPSHLTHIMQPLDVGVFQPWKHYHNQAIMHALRSLDFEYTISSLFHDLQGIRQSTFKESTIKHAFKRAGIWPVNCERALKKMRKFSQKKSIPPPSSPELPTPPTPRTIHQSQIGMEEWEQ